MELGAKGFAQLVTAIEDKQRQTNIMTLVVSQFLSFNDFSDKLNQMMIQILHITKLTTINEAMLEVSKTMPTIFSCEEIHLWMTDAVGADFISRTRAFFTRSMRRRRIFGFSAIRG